MFQIYNMSVHNQFYEKQFFTILTLLPCVCFLSLVFQLLKFSQSNIFFSFCNLQMLFFWDLVYRNISYKLSSDIYNWMIYNLLSLKLCHVALRSPWHIPMSNKKTRAQTSVKVNMSIHVSQWVKVICKN